MPGQKNYPVGVPCWVDLVQDDRASTEAFYAGLFGWTFDVLTPPEVPGHYAYALLDGEIVGGVGSPASPSAPAGWNSYMCVESADRAAASVEANGGSVLDPPTDVGPSGRVVQCADPGGAHFGLWEPAQLLGSQIVNAPGSWNFSELNSADPEDALRFYGAVFGWELGSLGPTDSGPFRFFRLPGYGEFLAARDPAMQEMMESDQIPAGFGDAVAILKPFASDTASPANHWSTTFAVADADSAFARAVELGAEVILAPFDTPYTRQFAVRDPQGAAINLSEYRPS
ncbi:MAG: VOC family protein [Aquihabitans sp.]